MDYCVLKEQFLYFKFNKMFLKSISPSYFKKKFVSTVYLKLQIQFAFVACIILLLNTVSIESSIAQTRGRKLHFRSWRGTLLALWPWVTFLICVSFASSSCNIKVAVVAHLYYCYEDRSINLLEEYLANRIHFLSIC